MYTDDERLRRIAHDILAAAEGYISEETLFLLLKAEAGYAAERAIERVHADILELTMNRPKTPPQPGQNRRKTDA